MNAGRLRWAEVDLAALAHNVGQFRARLGPATRLMAVVKADAYGHGAVPVGQAALRAGADWLAVSTLEEALALRDGGIVAPVLLLGPLAAGAEAEAITAKVGVSVHGADGLERLASAAESHAPGTQIPVHLKVDTGMARLGCPPDESLDLARRVVAAPGLSLEGLWTHFAEADDPASARTSRQLQAFMAVTASLAAAGIEVPVLHAANSAAALQFPGSQLTMVRCGLPLYGYPSGAVSDVDLRPVLAWKSRVVAVHRLRGGDRVGYGGTFTASGPTTVATVATGYADGYRRALSGRAEVLLHGRRLPVIGRVSMDFLTVDATTLPGTAEGDEVVLLGRQGEGEVTAVDLAGWMDSISWEVLVAIGPRVERVHLNA
ncbi:MAG: alanine racemase [Candidatus Dormibacteria bacterium]